MPSLSNGSQLDRYLESEKNVGDISYKLLERKTNDFLTAMRTLRNQTMRNSPKHLIEALGCKGQFPSRIEVVRVGQYKYMRRSEATTMHLTFAGIPQTSSQIDAALKRGQVRTKAVDSLASQYSTMYYGKTTGRFRRYGTHHWVVDGL